MNFVRLDAPQLPFRDKTFEIVVMHHVIEHIPQVTKLIQECKRVLKRGGLLHVAFPSMRYPYAAHLWETIYLPWCHLLFSEKTLINVLQKTNFLDSRIAPELREFHESPYEIKLFQSLSKITIRKFREIVKKTNFEIIFHEEKPPLKILSFLGFSALFIKEFFISNAVYILKKP